MFDLLSSCGQEFLSIHNNGHDFIFAALQIHHIKKIFKKIGVYTHNFMIFDLLASCGREFASIINSGPHSPDYALLMPLYSPASLKA